MQVRVTQLDGKLPNLALMRLSHWHREQGDSVHYTRSARRELFEPGYDRVYGSAIFKFSADKVERFKTAFPDAILGGTGTESVSTVEQIIGDYEGHDYSHWPSFSKPAAGGSIRKVRGAPASERRPSSKIKNGYRRTKGFG